MTMRRAGTALFSTAIVLALVAHGCAKTPSMIQASAPAPTAAPAPAPAPPRPAAVPAPAPVAPAPAPAATARPAPPEFTPAPQLADIHFDFDKSVIRPDSEKALLTSAEWLKKNPKRALLIEGHCDERGTLEYNLALGDRRAKATRDFLLAQGVAGDRITLISYGNERPQCAGHNEECWSRNRRAHLIVKAE
jgi:peptidoglycan-associated lipoprotein